VRWIQASLGRPNSGAAQCPVVEWSLRWPMEGGEIVTIGSARRSRFSRDGPNDPVISIEEHKGNADRADRDAQIVPRLAGQQATSCARAAIAVLAHTLGSNVPSSWESADG